MVSRICAFLVWACVAVSLAFWGLRLLARPSPVPALAVPVSVEHAVRGDILKLFPSAAKAQAAAQPAMASRFRVLGVVAASPTSDTRDGGVALISVDGRPPVAVHIGQRINRHEDLVVLAISRTSVGIGPAGGEVAATLTLPGLAAAAQGSLPAPASLIDAPLDDGADAQPAPEPDMQ